MSPTENQSNPAGGSPDPELPSSVMELIRKGDGHKIAAIKELRSQRPGLELAEAKRIVEETGARIGTMSVTKNGCFIATACLGDHDHPCVLELREFRDDRLMTTMAGRAVVERYYRWSPTPAGWVAKSRVLRALARVLIVAPALVVARMMHRGSERKPQGRRSSPHRRNPHA
jgi:hypothetical protein